MSVQVVQQRLDSYSCRTQLENKISAIDWNAARADVQRFIKPDEQPSLDLWGSELFMAQCRKLTDQHSNMS
jgi:hypothetical protein